MMTPYSYYPDYFDYSAPWYDITSIEDMLEATLLAFLPFLFGLVFLLTGIGIALYILGGVGQMKLAQKLDVPNGWLAFIPFAKFYLLGKLADFTPDGRMKQSRLRHILLWLGLSLIVFPFALGIVVGIAAVTSGEVIAMLFLVLLILAVIAAAIVFTVFYYIAVFRIYKTFEQNNYGLYFALTLVAAFLLGFPLESIFFFVLSRRPYSPFFPYPPQNGYGQQTPYGWQNGYDPQYGNGQPNGYDYPPQNGYAPPQENGPKDE
ncbi:MAG: hypothetical protein E7655_08940 [Ruminococcaceae bacterium]|nr:hypothetical protein [Oscillospiraceae bacterium]